MKKDSWNLKFYFFNLFFNRNFINYTWNNLIFHHFLYFKLAKIYFQLIVLISFLTAFTLNRGFKFFLKLHLINNFNINL